MWSSAVDDFETWQCGNDEEEKKRGYMGVKRAATEHAGIVDKSLIERGACNKAAIDNAPSERTLDLASAHHATHHRSRWTPDGELWGISTSQSAGDTRLARGAVDHDTGTHREQHFKGATTAQPRAQRLRTFLTMPRGMKKHAEDEHSLCSAVATLPADQSDCRAPTRGRGRNTLLLPENTNTTIQLPRSADSCAGPVRPFATHDELQKRPRASFARLMPAHLICRKTNGDQTQLAFKPATDRAKIGDSVTPPGHPQFSHATDTDLRSNRSYPVAAGKLSRQPSPLISNTLKPRTEIDSSLWARGQPRRSALNFYSLQDDGETDIALQTAQIFRNPLQTLPQQQRLNNPRPNAYLHSSVLHSSLPKIAHVDRREKLYEDVFTRDDRESQGVRYRR